MDDHVLVRDGLVAAARSMPGVSVVTETDSLAELAAMEPAADLVLLDMDLHGDEVSPQQVADILNRGSRVLIVSAVASPSTVRQMMALGVAGYVPKRDGTAGALRQAITEVLGGGYWTTPALAAVLSSDTSPERPELSERERLALTLYASGLKLTSVARRMEISSHTAKKYIDRVRAKYAEAGRNVGDKTSLYRAAVADGFLTGPDAAREGND
ncbi:MAG: response regulator transcription factor [Candidatus Nanopelagicales bacterium]|nr:response regulator transcription factor [Candidatus Nanopelagicales bacterium]